MHCCTLWLNVIFNVTVIGVDDDGIRCGRRFVAWCVRHSAAGATSATASATAGAAATTTGRIRMIFARNGCNDWCSVQKNIEKSLFDPV